MRRNLEPELAPDVPGLLVARKVDLAAHDHADELVARAKPLLLHADRDLRIRIVRVGRESARERVEGGAALRIEERLDRGGGVVGRVMDLRDVVYRGDAVIELAQA